MSVQAPVHSQRTRGSRGRRIAMIVWLVLFLLVAGVTVWRVVDYTSRPADQRVPAAGGTVTITEPGEYSVYADSGSQYGNWGSVSAVTGPSGAVVALERPSTSETYSAGDRSGIRVATFTADQAGAYTLTGAADGTAPGDELVVGSRTIGALLTVVFGGVATGFLLVIGLVGGLVMLLVGRRRGPRQAGPWGAGPPPPGWTPQPGWTPHQGGPAPGRTPQQGAPAPARTPRQSSPAPAWIPQQGAPVPGWTPQHSGAAPDRTAQQGGPAAVWTPRPSGARAPSAWSSQPGAQQPGAPHAVPPQPSGPGSQRTGDAADATAVVRPADRDDPTVRG